jgi:shikimate kinase
LVEPCPRLAWEFKDTDQAIVDRFGRSIASVFRDDGETVFRAAERDAVVEACDGTGRVISVGGGAPVDPSNRELLRTGNIVVRLDASPEAILDRLRHGPNAEERPMVAGADPLPRINALLASRSEAYAIAHLIVPTEGRTVDAIVDDIWLAVQQRASKDGQR